MGKPRPKDAEKYLLFAGNPGVGKSTLLNCIAKSRNPDKKDIALFKSGVSYGSGLTYELDVKEAGGVFYMDTPGLEDTLKREQAAKAITKALKKNGYYQVVFVVTLENGRVRPADLTTIKLILQSAPEITHYGVIFNQLSKKVLKGLSEATERELLTKISLLGGEKKPIPVPLFLQRYDCLDGEDNVTTEIKELESFLLKLFPFRITKEKVSDIPTESYEETNKAMEDELRKVREDNAYKEKLIKENEKRAKEVLEEQCRLFEEKYASMQAEFKEEKITMQKQFEEQKEQEKKNYEKGKAEGKQDRLAELKHKETLAKIESEERAAQRAYELKMSKEEKEYQIKLKEIEQKKKCTIS